MKTVIYVIFFVLVPIILILVGRNKREIFSSIITSAYATFLATSSIKSDNVILSIIIHFIGLYICSFIAFKIANLFDSDSKVAYIIGWSFSFAVPYSIFSFALSMTNLPI